MDILRRLLSPEYLVVSEPGPVGGLWPLYAALGLLFGVGLAAAMWILTKRQPATDREADPFAITGRGWAWLELWIGLAGLGTVIGRCLGWPGWSARIWLYSLAVLAIGGWLAYGLRHRLLPEWLADLLQALTYGRPRVVASTPAFRPATILGLGLHLAGVALVLQARYGWPWWLAPVVFAALVAPQWPLLISRRQPVRLLPLSPLLAAYGVTLLWLAYQGLGITIIGWQGQAFPNPLISLFYVDGIVLAAVAYSILCQLKIALTVLGRPAGLWRWAAAGLLVCTLAWAAGVYFGKRTHGVTATDPYAYAQMGVDLAERGTFLHRFALFQQVIPLNIAWAPLQPLGYHIPRNDLGDCPSVWAPGASVLLGAGYRLLGETGLYVTTPIVALLALAATWGLVHEVLRGQPPAVRHLTAALAVALLATSPENVDRLLVPMADAPAQLFTVLTVLFALRAMRSLEENPGRSGARAVLWFMALGGVCFAWAYWVRHTQLVLVLPAVLAVAVGIHTTRQAQRRDGVRPAGTLALGLGSLAIFGIVALVAAVPDIVYRWRVFGGLLRTETTELPLMAIGHIGPVAWQMLRDALVAGEWGYLFPLALYGTYHLIRTRWRAALVLGVAFAAVLLIHLTYRSLRLRDLISLFPFLDLAVAYGAVVLVRRAHQAATRHGHRWGPALLSAGAVAVVIASLGLARWAMIDNLWKPGWASFGYMRAEHRASFDRLAELTPDNAVIGTSLNSGAVMLYTSRDAIRPYDSWTREEWQTFLQAMHAAGRPIFLLDDGGLMADFIAQEQAFHRLTPIESLSLPLFYTQDRETGWLYRLEWDQ